MSVSSPDSLLEAPWSSCVVFKHFGAMIGFDDQNAGLSDSFLNKSRDVSEVRYPGQAGTGVEEVILSPLKIKPDRVVCIMRYAEWVDVE